MTYEIIFNSCIKKIEFKDSILTKIYIFAQSKVIFMKNGRLWRVLTTMDILQLNELHKFVSSPFFNKRQDIVTLLELYQKALKSQKGLPSKEATYAKIYPGQPYNDTDLHLITSKLYKLTERYLVVKAQEKNEANEKLVLASVYRNLGLEEHFERTVREAKQINEHQKLRNTEYYEQNYELLFEEFQFRSSSKRFEDFSLQELNNNLDITFISRKLRQSCALLNHQSLMSTKDYDFGLIEDIFEKIESNPNYQLPTILLYYYCFRLMKYNEEKDFFRLQELIETHFELMPMEELRDFYRVRINFCVKRFNAGDALYANNILKLYKEGLAQQILLESGKLTRTTFMNIVRTAIASQEWEWASNFVVINKQFLPADMRESVANVALGHLAYSQNQYDQAIKHLQFIDGVDALFHMNTKLLLLKIYYELGEFDLLDSHLNAMQSYLTRHNELGYHKQVFRNVIKYALRLMKLTRPTAQQIENIIEEIKNADSLAEKKWFIEQFSALKTVK